MLSVRREENDRFQQKVRRLEHLWPIPVNWLPSLSTFRIGVPRKRPAARSAALETTGRPREKNAWLQHRQPLWVPSHNLPLPKVSISHGNRTVAVALRRSASRHRFSISLAANQSNPQLMCFELCGRTFQTFLAFGTPKRPNARNVRDVCAPSRTSPFLDVPGVSDSRDAQTPRTSWTP